MWFRIALISTTHQGQTNDSLQGPWVQSLSGSCIPQFSLTSACDMKMPSNQGQRASPTCTLSFCPVLHVVLCLQLHGAHAITCYVPLVSDVSKAVPGGLKPHDVPSLPTQTAELRSGLRIPDKSVAFIPEMWDCSTPRKGLRLDIWSRTVDRTWPLVQMESIISALWR